MHKFDLKINKYKKNGGYVEVVTLKNSVRWCPLYFSGS
jgi:hypothetical protein